MVLIYLPNYGRKILQVTNLANPKIITTRMLSIINPYNYLFKTITIQSNM